MNPTKTETRLCECGCGEALTTQKRFFSGHNLRSFRLPVRTPEHCENISKALMKRNAENPRYLDGKLCTRCNRVQPLSEFGVHKNGRWIRSRCYTCEREQSKRNGPKYRIRPEDKEAKRRSGLQARYGVGPETYDRLFAEQDGACAICGATEPGGERYKYFSIDHNHETGAVRGLLCNTCNTGIGFLRDNPAVMRSAADYVEKHGGK